MSFVVHQQNANAIAIINQATGGALRAADAHTVDAKAAPTGPNAQLHIYNLGGGKEGALGEKGGKGGGGMSMLAFACSCPPVP